MVTRFTSPSPMLGMDPILESLLGQQGGSCWSTTLSPSLFTSLDSGESVHSFMFRSLSEMVGQRSNVEQVISFYFGSVNTWFTIVERATFEAQVEDMWATPSAETALLVICMLLIVRTPYENTAPAMDDCLYLSAKAAFALVQSRVPLSTSLLQSKLLIALYEYSHSMPQQAYISLGTCVQMSKAFGWFNKNYWSEERQQLLPAELKLSSIQCWAVVYVDW